VAHLRARDRLTVRIALASDWFAPRRGGIETQLVELATRLAARGHVVDVLTTTPGATRGDAPYSVRSIRSLRIPGVDVAVSPTLARTLRAELAHGYDVVHSHVSVVSPTAYAAVIAARSLSLPTVVSFHSVLRMKQGLLALADRFTGMGAGPTIWSGVSELVSAQLRSAMPHAKVVTLSNATDLQFWRSAPRRPAGPVTFVSTSRLHRKKRASALVSAFARARVLFDAPARLIVLGEGPEAANIRQMIVELGLGHGDHTVELEGWVSRAALRSLYAQSHAFVLASRRESFGIAALEARAAGLPVIAMRESGSTEFLDDGGAILCDDDAQLSGALARFVNEAALRDQLQREGPDLAAYDWGAVLDAHEAVYAAAIERASATRAATSA
jgi:glycosyltransferase involved in cell wall biosynthesis